MATSVTPDCIASIVATGSSEGRVDLVIQVVELKAFGNRFHFYASDGVAKLKATFSSELGSKVAAGNLQNYGLFRIADYTLNDVPGQPTKVLIVLKGDVVVPLLDHEIVGTSASFPSGPSIILHPKAEKTLGETVVMSAAQIVQGQRGTAAPAARMGISRRVYPLVSLNPYQGNWTIKVRVTSKGPMRSFRNSRGEGSVFNVELTDEDGTQIQATMFKEAADKFYPKLELGKVYYISKGSLRVANKQYSTVKNDYEMTLNINSNVEEISEAGTNIPQLSVHPVKIDELGPYVNGRELVDIVGVVQNVASVVSIRRKINNEEIPKRDVTIADESKKTVVVSFWNELATKEGDKLLDLLKDSPVVLIKGARVSDFQGVSLSTTQNSLVLINPDLPEVHTLRLWFNGDGKNAQLIAAGASLPGGAARNGPRSVYAERECVSEMIKPNVGEDKPAYFNLRAYITYIKPDQAMWYLACQSCNRKVIDEHGSKFWCEGCQKHYDTFNRRYIMTVKISDYSGEGWVSTFNEAAEHILGHSADDLAEIRSQDSDTKAYEAELKRGMWVAHVFRVSVAQSEYMNEKRQRITIRSLSPVDWAGEGKHLLHQISKLKAPTTE